MKLRDKYGWPIELIENRPIINFIRKLIHTDIIATFRYRAWDGTGIDPGSRGEFRHLMGRFLKKAPEVTNHCHSGCGGDQCSGSDTNTTG